MKNKEKRIIFHIDTNSAFLSWEAVHRLKMGKEVDLRKIPSVVGGNREKRHGVVLAKSIPAKKYNINTGEPIVRALEKCPSLEIVPPNFDIYIKYSKEMVNILKEYSPCVQRYSIDECFLDYTGMYNIYGEPIQMANKIKDRIKNELGFTVNIGVGSNKLLAKMASDFEKPDKVHTLFENEVKKKMWPLSIEKLFMVGRATASKLKGLNINTIGDLARYDLEILQYKFKKYGTLIWKYANGIDESEVDERKYIKMKGIGNSTTLPYDIKEKEVAYEILISLVETVSMRLRDSKNLCSSVAVSIKNSSFKSYSHQRKLDYHTNSTDRILEVTKELFDEMWKGDPIRLLGVRVGYLCSDKVTQVSIFDKENIEKNAVLDRTIDEFRIRYGKKSVIRSRFLKINKRIK
ncbi:DNA polymerase Y family protein [Clostridium ganghwense]|uniref:DNA polymerase IV n=1 Tax=Clostridium ganghwense TaxID=312089 RepID=A0ABT4CP10_9CLOT|nr:DNA polymerase IV [Clostridium ganghwense]MCY6370789.1 DNA polymerase IV [Clostridium ganghwense]